MQILINGLISGAAIALLALGFSAVYLPTRVFFIASAAIYALAPFVALSVKHASGSMALAALVSILVSIGVSVSLELLIHSPLEKRRGSSGAHLMASLGAYTVIVSIVAMIWGNEAKTLRQGLDSVSNVNGVIVAGAQWVMLAGSLLAITLFLVFLKHADLGLRLRALADNPTQFALIPYNINRYRLLSFSCSGILVSIASLVAANDNGFDPHAGLNAVLLAIVAVIVGGRSTFVGPVLGGLLLGIVRSEVVWHWSARWQEPASFAILAAVLLFMPHGLMGSQERLETQ